MNSLTKSTSFLPTAHKFLFSSTSIRFYSGGASDSLKRKERAQEDQWLRQKEAEDMKRWAEEQARAQDKATEAEVAAHGGSEPVTFAEFYEFRTEVLDKLRKLEDRVTLLKKKVQ